jgi:hypothetical protein
MFQVVLPVMAELHRLQLCPLPTAPVNSCPTTLSATSFPTTLSYHQPVNRISFLPYLPPKVAANCLLCECYAAARAWHEGHAAADAGCRSVRLAARCAARCWPGRIPILQPCNPLKACCPDAL